MILRTVYLFVLTVLFAVLETALGTVGIRLALLPCLIFYAGYVYGPGYGIGFAVFAGFLLDNAAGLTHPWSIPGYLAAAGIAALWLYRVESDSLFLVMFPGALLALVGILPRDLLAGGFSRDHFLEALTDTLANSLLCFLLFPVLIIILDYFSGKLDLGIYGTARERLKKETV